MLIERFIVCRVDSLWVTYIPCSMFFRIEQPEPITVDVMDLILRRSVFRVME